MVKQLHQLGYCHGGLSLRNVMENDQGQIVLIDFAFVDEIGQHVPTYFSGWVYRDSVFDVKSDEVRLNRFFSAD